MTHHVHDPAASTDVASASVDPGQIVLRLLRVFWFRRNYIYGALILAGILGAIKYQTSDHVYAGSASLLITQTGDYADASSLVGGNGMLPTYAKLITSAKVLKTAVRAIRQLSPDLYADFRGKPFVEWTDLLRQRLEVRTERLTNFVELRYRSCSKPAAEAVLNAVVTSYMDLIEKHHRDVSVELLTRLSNDRKDVERQLHQQQDELIKFKDEVRYVGVQDGDKTVHAAVVQMNRLHQSLMETRQSRITHESIRKAIYDTIRRGGDATQHLLTFEPTLGRQLLASTLGINARDSETLAAFERKLVDDQATLQSLNQQLGPNHPLIGSLQQKIAVAQSYVAEYRTMAHRKASLPQGEELNRMIVAMIEERLAKDWAQETRLQQEYDAAESAAVQMNGTLTKVQYAEQELERLNDLHRTLSNQMAQVDLQQGHADVRVEVTSAPVGRGPVEPRLKLIAAFSLVVGLMFGCAAAIVADQLDDHFRSPEEIKQHLAVPVLAMIRKLDSRGEFGPDSLHVHANPEAVECEAFRTLRTTLAFSGEDLSRLAVTSTAPGDGKTTVLANLAVSYAQAGRRTLLIDADLRKPGLSNLFQLRREHGLSDVLRDDHDLDQTLPQALRDVGAPNLTVLPCGHKPPNPVELLSSQRMVDLMAWAQRHFDQVLIDCPPVLAGSDAVLAGRLTDGLIVVLDPSKNRRRDVTRAIDSVRQMKVPVLGVVANRIDAEQQGYGGYGYGYGYGYGNGYGADDEEAATAAVDQDSGRTSTAGDASEAPLVRRASNAGDARAQSDGPTVRRAA